jgi:hypothetical protein
VDRVQLNLQLSDAQSLQQQFQVEATAARLAN